MRKWMSGRGKRRKKASEGSKERPQNVPEPLQPKYFESEIGEKPVEQAGPEPAPQRSTPPRIAQHPVQERTTSGRETQADFQLGTRGAPELPLAEAVRNEGRATRPSRRRRKRGGRGESPRSAPATRPVSTPARREAAEVSIPKPDVSEVTSEEEPLTPEGVGDVSIPDATSVVVPQPLSAEQPPAVAQGASAGPAPAPPVRPSKGTVVLSIGLPGSGKSSWFKRHSIRPLSSDLLRELLFDDEQEQRFQDLVFSNLRSMLKARLIARRPMSYVDATNLTPHDRHSWIKLAKDYGYDVQGLYFDVPLEVCLERHQRRGRAVPEAIMRKMAAKLKPPTFEEGFSKITVVRVKQKDAAAS